jgi:hypothetical protein
MTSKVLGPTAEPELSDLLDDLKVDTSTSLNCVKLGTIQSYDPITNTAKVSINFKIEMANGDIKEYPQLEDCPVYIMGGGDSYISFPIAKGDTCLVLFNDVNIDNWYLTGETTTPWNSRKHDIADGIVLVGIRSINNAVFNSIGSLLIEGGSKKITLKNDENDLKTLIGDQVTVLKDMIDTIKDMNTQINSLIDLIGAITVTGVTAGVAASGPPANTGAITGLKTNFENYNTALDGFKTDLTTFTTDLAKLLDEGLT